MMSCPNCGMDNNDGTVNCWKCNYPLTNVEPNDERKVKKEVEKTPKIEEKTSDAEKQALSESTSKKLMFTPLFAVVLIIIRFSASGINITELFSSGGIKENFAIICLTILLGGLFINVGLIGFIPLFRKKIFNQSIPVKKRNKILSTINKFNSASKLYSESEVSYKEVVMSNTLNIIFIPMILTITFGSLIYNTPLIAGINSVFSVITLIIGVLVYVYPEKLNGLLKEDIRSSEGYTSLFVIAHIPLVLLVIMIILNL